MTSWQPARCRPAQPSAVPIGYDTRNRRTSRTDALAQQETWTYDGIGRVLTHTDRKHQVTELSYDALGRSTLVSYADGSGTQASYDAANRLTDLTDTASGALHRSYDDLDCLTSETTAQGSVSYGYDIAGRRTRMTAATQAMVSYAYDDANSLISLTQGNEAVQFAYEDGNRRTQLTLPNGITVHYGYDDASELTALTYAKADGTSIGDLAYGYDFLGHRVHKGSSLATSIPPMARTQPSTFDANSRMTTFNGQAMSYDSNGNLINDGINTYTRNARNQLTEVSQNGVAQLSYAYDAMGRRIGKTVRSGTPTQFLYDGDNTVQEAQGSAINPILTGFAVDERYARNDVTGRTYF